MADQFVAEIRMFGCNFPPKGWAQCNGQIMSISQNTALFSLLGTNYGGDGRSNFGLPNLQGATALCAGNGPGLSQYHPGDKGGVPSVTLVTGQIANHFHAPNGSTSGTVADPNGQIWANPSGRPGPFFFATAIGTAQTMNPNALAPTGGGQPHNNLMPYQVINFCIALQGVFPQRP